MPSIVLDYASIVAVIRDSTPDARARLALQRTLIADGRVVIADVEYRLTATRRLAAHTE